jgi:hypothetical protein
MQAGKAYEQPPTHAPGDTAHAETIIIIIIMLPIKP